MKNIFGFTLGKKTGLKIEILWPILEIFSNHIFFPGIQITLPYDKAGNINLSALRSEMFKCSKGVTGILTALILSSLSHFDLGTDSFNGYTFLNGANYKKSVRNQSDVSVKDCKWIGGMQNYDMTGNETKNYGKETFNYDCYEVDIIWGIITLLIVFLPGVRQVAAFMNSKGAFKKLGWFKKMALYVSMLFTFPFQLIFVKFVEPFGGPEWSKVGSLYSGMEAMWEGAPQLMLQLFIIFSRTDRQPSFIQLISLITSFASFMIAHRPKPDLTLKEKAKDVMHIAPCYFLGIVAVALIASVVRYTFAFFVICSMIYRLWVEKCTTGQRDKGFAFTGIMLFIGLCVLSVWINFYPHTSIWTGYPRWTKVSDVPILKEVEVNLFLFSFKNSYFNLIAHSIIALAVIYSASRLRISIIEVPKKFWKDGKPKYIFSIHLTIPGEFWWRPFCYYLWPKTEEQQKKWKFIHEHSPCEPSEEQKTLLVSQFCKRYDIQENEDGQALSSQFIEEELLEVVSDPVVTNAIEMDSQ